MIEIVYRPEARNGPLGWEHRQDCGTASRGDLLWYFFLGDVDILTDGVEFKTQFGWVPVLHFGSALLGAAEELTQVGARCEYSFTEADEWISFVRREGYVHIQCSYAPGRAVAKYEDFKSASRAFVDQTIAALGNTYPSLLNNDLITEIRDKLREETL